MIRDRDTRNVELTSTVGAQSARAAKPAGAAKKRPAGRADPSRATLWTRLKFGSLGFILGALFWHAVGFWNFVGYVVLNKGSQTAQSDTRSPKLMARFVETPQVAGEAMELTAIDPTTCAALVLNRLTGALAVAPCPAAAMPLRMSRAGVREDASLMPVRRNVPGSLSWPTTVEQQASADN